VVLDMVPISAGSLPGWRIEVSATSDTMFDLGRHLVPVTLGAIRSWIIELGEVPEPKIFSHQLGRPAEFDMSVFPMMWGTHG